MGKLFSLLGALVLVFSTGCSSDPEPESSEQSLLSGNGPQQVFVDVKFVYIDRNFNQSLGITYDLEANTEYGSSDTSGSSGLGFDAIVDANLIGGQSRSELLVPATASSHRFNPMLNPTFGAHSFTKLPPGLFLPDLNDINGSIPRIYDFVQEDPPSFANAAGLNFRYTTFDDIQLQNLLDQLQQSSQADLIAAPSLTLFNGQGAAVNSGNFQLPLGYYEHSLERRMRQLIPDAEYANTGATFQFTPFTNGSFIDIEFNPGTQMTMVSEEIDVNNQPRLIEIPTVLQSRLTTRVQINDGETVVLGGTRRKETPQVEDGVPILGKLPVLNRLFNNQSIQDERQTLLVLVTARLAID